MSAPPTFSEITERIKVMGDVALNLAKARETDAKARLTRAQASGVEFQVIAAVKFLRRVEIEGMRLRRRARTESDRGKLIKRKWTSGRAIFRGNRISNYPLRKSNLVFVLEQMTSTNSIDLFEFNVKARSRKGDSNFIHSSSSISDEVPSAPNDTETAPELLQFVLDNKLVVKPLSSAMSDFSKMLAAITAFQTKEVERLQKIAEELSAGSLAIWEDVPIFGRDSEE